MEAPPGTGHPRGRCRSRGSSPPLRVSWCATSILPGRTCPGSAVRVPRPAAAPDPPFAGRRCGRRRTADLHPLHRPSPSSAFSLRTSWAASSRTCVAQAVESAVTVSSPSASCPAGCARPVPARRSAPTGRTPTRWRRPARQPWASISPSMAARQRLRVIPPRPAGPGRRLVAAGRVAREACRGSRDWLRTRMRRAGAVPAGASGVRPWPLASGLAGASRASARGRPGLPDQARRSPRRPRRTSAPDRVARGTSAGTAAVTSTWSASRPPARPAAPGARCPARRTRRPGSAPDPRRPSAAAR